MAGFWEQFIPGAANAAGAGYVFNQLNNSQGDIHDMFADMQKGGAERTQFQPWSVKSNQGSVKGGPDGMSVGLTGEALDRFNQMQRNSGRMMNRAAQDPTEARNNYYDLMRGAQSPEEQRQKQMMDSRLLAQGRSGVRSNAHGGSPEQLAMFKAMEENKNQAMLNADQMAQQGLMNQANMGSRMFSDSFMPMDMLMQQGVMGQNNAQMNQKGQLAYADMYNQLGTAQATSDTNYDNMMTKVFTDLMTSANPLFQQSGGWLDERFGTGGGGQGSVWESIYKVGQDEGWF